MTFSDIIEKKKAKAKKELEIYKKKEREIEKIVISQFNKAKETIGNKLTMSKLHSSMFHFYFGSDEYIGYHTATLHSSGVESNGIFELYHYIPHVDCKELNNFRIKIKLKELSQRLIQYTRLILKTRGIEV